MGATSLSHIEDMISQQTMLGLVEFCGALLSVQREASFIRVRATRSVDLRVGFRIQLGNIVV